MPLLVGLTTTSSSTTTASEPIACGGLLVCYGKTMRLRRYTRLAGRQGRPRGAPTYFLFCHAGGFGAVRRYILLVAAYGKTMRLRRYTRPSGSQWRPQGAPTCFLCFLLFVFCFSTMSMFSCCRFGFRPRGQLPPGGAGFSGWVRPLAWSDFPDGTAGKPAALFYRFPRLWLARLFPFWLLLFLPFWCSGR